MKKIFLCIIFSWGVTVVAPAQNINEYRFVKVPEKFDFLKEENQYQLNALTAFLFEKHGFEVVYRQEIPREADPCEVLRADVHSDSNLFRSKLYVTLENCRNEIVFTSETGVSREKDYKMSYHEALRKAFDSVEDLDYNFVAAAENATSPEISQDEEFPGEVVVDPVVTAKDIKEETPEANPSGEIRNIEASGNRKYLNGGVTYTLKETSSGYELFRQGQEEKFASLMKSGSGDNYLYSSKNFSGNAFFDGQGNLVVEYMEPNSQQVITVNYKLQAQ